MEKKANPNVVQFYKDYFKKKKEPLSDHAVLAEVRAFIQKSMFISDLIDSHGVYHDEIDEWNKLLNKLSEHF